MREFGDRKSACPRKAPLAEQGRGSSNGLVVRVQRSPSCQQCPFELRPVAVPLGALTVALQIRHIHSGCTPAAITRNAVIGATDSLVSQIVEVITGGEFDWLGFYFPDYLADLEFFGTHVLPRLVERGVGLQHSQVPTLVPI